MEMILIDSNEIKQEAFLIEVGGNVLIEQTLKIGVHESKSCILLDQEDLEKLLKLVKG